MNSLAAGCHGFEGSGVVFKVFDVDSVSGVGKSGKV